MPGKDKLFLRIGDKTIINYTAKDKDTRVAIDMTGASAKVRQTIYTDENNPTTTTVSDKTIDQNVDATKGEITDGVNGKFRFIYIPADLSGETEALKKHYYFATKMLDVNGDPTTVEEGVCTFGKLLVTTPV